MNVLLVQNHGVEDADLVAAGLVRRGVPHTIANSFLAAPLPKGDRFTALIVFGSPASCTKLEEYPFLLPVRDLTAEFVAAGKPVLGICFGGQLLAQVMGAEVRQAEAPEVGCHDVRLTREGRESEFFAGFPEVFPTAQWHSDAFAIPAKAKRLAGSDFCPAQAFAAGRCVGLQFHLEASLRKVAEWMVKYRDQLPKDGKSPDQMLADFVSTAAQRERLCDLFTTNFLRAAGGSGPRP